MYTVNIVTQLDYTIVHRTMPFDDPNDPRLHLQEAVRSSPSGNIDIPAQPQ